jgi:Peroxisomal biogenesis factor 11 (PEX11)
VAILSQLDRLSRRRLEKTALAVAAQVDGNLLPGETLIATISQDPGSRLVHASKRLRALADLIADIRAFLRVWGTLGIWSWGSEVLKEPPKDKVLKWITWMQIGANVAYQYLENGAYLAQHGILGLDEQKQMRWWVWSSRFWMAHVVLDFGRLWREKMTREVDKECEDWEAQHLKREEKWWRDTYVNAAYAPLTLHWSLEGGAVGETWVGILGSIAGILGFREMWRSTA